MINNRCHTISAASALLLALMAATVIAAPPIVTGKTRHLFTITGGAAGSLSLPTDVAIGVDGKIYVVDGGNHRVVIYNRRGRHIKSIGRPGAKPGEFRNPVGICVDNRGYIYVADKDNHRIQVFDADGRFEYLFEVSDKGEPVMPVDIASSTDGKRLFVTGNNNHRVMMFSRRGNKIKQWGGEGVNKGEFRYPATIAVANNGRIYVVDVFNTRIQVFDRQGKYELQFGEWGVLSGQLVRPKGVALDRRGRIYVSDSYMDVIQVFDDAHRFQFVLGDNGKAQRFIAAGGIAIDDSDRLYVTEVLKNRVSVYQLER